MIHGRGREHMQGRPAAQKPQEQQKPAQSPQKPPNSNIGMPMITELPELPGILGNGASMQSHAEHFSMVGMQGENDLAQRAQAMPLEVSGSAMFSGTGMIPNSATSAGGVMISGGAMFPGGMDINPQTGMGTYQRTAASGTGNIDAGLQMNQTLNSAAMPSSVMPLMAAPVQKPAVSSPSPLPTAPETPSMLIARAGSFGWEELPGGFKIPAVPVGEHASVLVGQNGEYRWVALESALPDIPAPPPVEIKSERRMGFLAWTYDPALAGMSTAPQMGCTYLLRMPNGGDVERVGLYITQGGSGFSGTNQAAVYSYDGKKLAATADQGTHWTTSGAKWMVLDRKVTLGQEGGWLAFTVQAQHLPTFQCSTNSPVHSFGFNGKDLRFAKVAGYPEQVDFASVTPAPAWWGGIG